MADLVDCKGCDKRILSPRTTSRAPMPLDPTPNLPEANVEVGADGFATVISGRRLSEHRSRGIPLYRRHECGGGR